MPKKFTWSKIEGDYWAYYDDEELGFIEYYKPWKKWVWNQREEIIMSLSCLDNVCRKIYALSKKGEGR